MRMPSHIKISRHGIYYFRIVIPQRLRLYFCGKLEIKKSLKTTDWRSARMQARLLALKAEWAFSEAERQRMTSSPPDIDSDQLFGLILNVDLKSGTLRVESDPNSLEDGEQAIRAVQALAPALAAYRFPDASAMTTLSAHLCWRAFKTDQLRVLNFDQTFMVVDYYTPMDKSTKLTGS